MNRTAEKLTARRDVRARGLILFLAASLTALLSCGSPAPGPVTNIPNDQTPSPTPTAQEPRLHASGTIAVKYEGVDLPPPEPNTSGPSVFRAVDLDEGKMLPATTDATDVTLVVDARLMRVALSL